MKILIIGATSAIAQATARLYAARKATLYLIARDPERLDQLAADLRVRGAPEVHTDVLDVNDFERHAPALEKAVGMLGGLDLALIAHGTLGDQRQSQQNFAAALKELNTNAISVMSLLTWLANDCEQRHHGILAVIGSVAGDRGRQSNYVYGTAKAALATFLQGLRNRLHRHGVHVITVKPGFVDTPMTASFKKGPLWRSPAEIAAGIVRAVDRRRDVVYLPGWWRYVMTGIRAVPESVFKRMPL